MTSSDTAAPRPPVAVEPRPVLVVLGRSAGGIGAHVADVVAGLPRHGWRAVVAASPDTASRFDLGDDVHPGWPAPRRLRRLAAGAELVHAHGHQAGLLSSLVLATLPASRRPPLVVSWHNAVLGSGVRRRVLGLAERVQARRADLVTGASEDLVERARALGGHAEIAPVAAPAATAAGVATREDARRALADELGLDTAAPWLLTVGRIAPQKDLPTLVRAAARTGAPVDGAFAGHRPVWLVAGGGDRAAVADLRRRVERSGAPVHLLGAREDVPALLRAADLFVLPSTWEARSLAVQEAMAAGVPVVTTDTGGLPALLDGAGVLVPPGDDAALAGAVGGLLRDDLARSRAARRGREVFAALPTPTEVVAAWAVAYTGLRPRGRG